MTAQPSTDPLAAFAPATGAWFRAAFPQGPTPVQARAWEVIRSGGNALVIAPTGSGKTLAAFLSAIDGLGRRGAVPEPGGGAGRAGGAEAPVGEEAIVPTRTASKPPARGVTVLYISPLKALGADVERNLRRPLAGITEAAAALGVPTPPIAVGVRSGDTPAAERRRLATRPPDILITTPESLYLMLTSKARDTLRTVETVIVDEIHSFAGEKRGTHLALSLERLDALLPRPAQRIGLSATVSPREEIARFLGGTHPVRIVADDGRTLPDVAVAVPVDDMARVPATEDRRARMDRALAGPVRGAGVRSPAPPRPGRGDGAGAWRSDRALRRAMASGSLPEADAVASSRSQVPLPARAAAGAQTTASIWPHIEEAVLDQVLAHRSTIVFVNSRGLCERLTAHLNEAYAMRLAQASRSLDDYGAAGRPVDDASVLPASAGGSADDPWGVDAAPAPLIRPAEPALHRESREMGDASHALALPEGAPVIARAHHGSVSKDQRLEVERALKAGELRCVVATASLELGIDMGSVDLVLQVAPPPSVASGLQRVGRADHRVGGRPRGTIYPVQRTQLVDAAVVSEGMRAGLIEETQLVTNALDVLAQQTVAAAALEDLRVEDWYGTVRRAAPYRDLPRCAFDSVLELVSGGFATADLADFAPRLTWDRGAGTIRARPGAQRLAVGASGTIPDRGMFPVVLPEGEAEAGRRRVGELDEEMVNETAVGDVITLGTSSWRVREITGDRVVVDPAPGRSARLPFWHGEGPGRPAATGAAKGAFLREAVAALPPGVAPARLEEASPAVGPDGAAGLPPEAAASRMAGLPDGSAGRLPQAEASRVAGALDRAASPSPEGEESTEADTLTARLRADGLDASARRNLIALLREQRAATGVVPSDRTLVLERWQAEDGSWRLVLHSPWGRRVHEPWAMAIRERARRVLGIEPQMVVADDGIVLQLPLTEGRPPGAELVVLDADEVTRLVTSRIGETAVFAARFRECAARALLMPAAQPGRRTPLWLQRLKAGQLLEASRQFESFPISVEAARECLQDVYDLPALADLLRAIAAGGVRVVEATTSAPSPFASPLVLGYTASLLYQGDLPHAERAAHLLSLDPAVVAELMGEDGAADLLDDAVLAAVDAELQRLAPGRRARADAEGIVDLLRELGPLDEEEIAERCEPDAGRCEPDAGRCEPDAGRCEPDAGHRAVRAALEELATARRALPVTLGGVERWARAEDAPDLHDALGTAVPDWALSRPESSAVRRREGARSPLGGLVLRTLRTHAVLVPEDVAARLGLGSAVIRGALARLAEDGDALRLGVGDRWMAPAVFKRVRNRSLALAREAVRPVAPEVLQELVLERAGIVEPRGGLEALGEVLAQMEGVWLPAAQWEETVLPARVADYRPAMLDELLASGEVVWVGRGGDAVAGADGGPGAAGAARPAPPEEIAFYPSDSPLAPLDDGPLDTSDPETLWAAVRAGAASCSSLEPIRRSLRPAAAPAPRRVRTRRGRGRYGSLTGGQSLSRALGATAGAASGADGAAGAAAAAVGPGQGPGSSIGQGLGAGAGTGWRALRPAEASPEERALAVVESLLDRYAVISCDIALAAGEPGGLGPLQPLLRRMEDTGALLRGRFVTGQGPQQLAERDTIDLLRARSGARGDRPGGDEGAWVEGRAGSDRAALADGGALVALDLTDPACLIGRGVPWPEPALPDDLGGGAATSAEPTNAPAGWSAAPARRRGTTVVLVAGRPVLHATERLRTLTAFTRERSVLVAAVRALVQHERRAMEREERAARRVVETLNGIPAMGREVARMLGEAGLELAPGGVVLRAGERWG